MIDGEDEVKGCFKGISYDHSPLELAVSFVGLYPGNGLFEARVTGKKWTRFAGSCVSFSHH